MKEFAEKMNNVGSKIEKILSFSSTSEGQWF
jgi:hypothetical protein